jgi:inhibitor of cysteine peptidase
VPRVVIRRASTRSLLETAIALIVCGCIGYALLSAVEESLADSSQVVTVTEADNGNSVELTPGDTLVIALETNPGTGYVWQVESVDTSKLRPSGQGVFHPGRQMPGAPGRQTFLFTAQKPGTAILKLVYVRPWEKSAPPGKTYELTVAIK